MRSLKYSLFLILSILLITPAWAQTTILLTVQEPTGTVARVSETVTSGVPLPVGVPRTGWALFDGTKELPLQVTPLKGRGNWMLLDFQTDVNAGQSKILTLKQQSPISAGPILAPAPPVTKIAVVLSGSTTEIIGVPSAPIWEYQGALRSVLRVNGTFPSVPGFGYTIRYTFYKGKQTVRVETVLRNSLQANERHLKLTAATLTLGSGASLARAGLFGLPINVVSTGAAVNLLPIQQPGIRQGVSGGADIAISVDQNGGYLLPDLTHYGVVVVLDPLNQQPASTSPLFAIAPSSWYAEHGQLTTEKFGSLEDERETYRDWGWTWAASQEPSYPHQSDYVVTLSRINVHSDSESDATWANLLMFIRTGMPGYWDRTRGWAHYNKWEMAHRTDGFPYAWDGNWVKVKVTRPTLLIPMVTTADNLYLRDVGVGKVDIRGWGGDHTWGWGLLDYYKMTGDIDALEAAEDIGETLEQMWLTKTDYSTMYGTRGIARNLMLAVRLYEATGSPRWKTLADHIMTLLLASPGWNETWGMYIAPRIFGGLSVGPHHIAELHHAMWQYDMRIGNSEARRRLIKMAAWVKDHAMHPKWLQSSKNVVLDLPTVGQVSYGDGDVIWTDAKEPIVNSYHTFAWVDTLVRGYRMTGDITYLQKAKLYWDRGSKAGYLKLALYRTAGDDQVGVFANRQFACCGTHPMNYLFNGNLQFNHLLWWDGARTGENPPPPTQFSVAVIKAGLGQGTVTGAGNYPAGSWTGSATPASGSRFDGWSGCSVAKTPVLILTLAANITCTATFSLITVPPVPVVSIDRFDAIPPAVGVGQDTLLTWTTTNAKVVTLNGVVVATNGTQRVAPIIATSYVLVADGISRSLTVMIASPPPPTEDRAITINGIKYKIIEVMP